MKRGFLIAAAASLLLAAGAFAVQAQTVIAPTVDAGSIYSTFEPYLKDGFAALVTIFVGWAAARFSAKTGIDIDAKHRDALHSAIVTGINLGISRGGQELQGKQVNVGNQVIADAINWVNHSVPGALDHFGITPQTLTTMIEAKVPQVTGATAPVPAPSVKT